VPVPLKLIDEPEEAVGLFWPLVGLSWKPVNVSASVRKLLALSVGLSMICSAVSAPLVSPLVRLIGGALAVTVTLSATRGSSLKSTTRVSFRFTWTPSRITVPNPVRAAVTV
jgi:hypothetical protein